MDKKISNSNTQWFNSPIDNFNVSSLKDPHLNFKTNSSVGQNFNFKTRIINDSQKKHNLNLNKNTELPKKKKNAKDKKFIINGVDYFGDQTVVDEKAQVLQDCYSIKGDYFYLKKGEIVTIRYRVREFAQIKYHKFVGYFPSKMFRLVVGGYL